MLQNTSQKRVMFLRRFLLVGGAFFAVASGLVFGKPHTAVAATTSTLNFQARLMSNAGAIVPDGNYNVEFKLYNASSSTGGSQGTCGTDTSCLWVETRTSGNQVRVANGYLTVNLGSVTAFPTTINWDQDLYLTMNIGGTGTPSWDGEMSPRLRLTAVPYAFRAGQLATLNGSNSSTLGFVQPTANRSILLPDESGTLCIQSSVNCGFALSSGSGNYIQNGTSVQSGANFNISGSGTAGTSFLTPLLDTPTATALAIGTTNATAINLNKATAVTGNLSQSGGTISLAATGTATISATGALSLSGSSTAISSSSTTSVTAANNSNLTLSTGGTGQVQIASGTGGIALKANGGNTVLNVDTSANRVTAGVNSFGTASATGTGQLFVSGANNAAIAGSVATGNTTYRVATQGRYAYVQIYNALKVVDVAVPTSPTIVGSATTTSGVSALAVGAGYVYSLSNNGNTLQTVDVSNPSSPTVTSTVSVTSPYAATVSGRYLYVLTQDTTANFRVYDLSNPGTPRFVTSLTASGSSVPYAVAIQGKYAYLASSGILQSINIANPAAPVSAGTLVVNSATSIAVQGKYAYLVNSSSAKLQVVNIANPASMTSVSNTIALPSDAQEIVVQDRIAYVTSGTGTSLRWYDISTPSAPVILGTYNVASALRGISVQGRYAYIADNGASALDVVDLGGAYLQQVEAGSLQATTLTIDGSSTLAGDTTIGGALQVAQSARINGDFSVSGNTVFQSATNSTTAFQIQNATGTSLFNVDTTSNGLITMGTALRLNVTSTNADTFTTPLASSVKTAINIPLFNPGAYGQIMAFGLPSTADTTARAISVFDARSSGTIQPAIALFSPNENDLFGLSWNGLNTTASLETASAAIALRPGGTNVKLWAGSTGVAIGSNVSSAAYPLDVTGDVNTSTQYRIGGTVICTATGCTPAAGSTNYIQNTTTAQSANMYVQAATSGSVAATLRANAAGAGDILDLKNGAGTNVATFGSTGSISFQTSTNATSAFQVQGTSTGVALNVDTVNARVGVGGITTPALSLDVEGGIQQTGIPTSNTQGTDANKWTLLGTCTIAAQYRQCISTISILGGHDGNAADDVQATVSMRVKQQNAMGGVPYINLTLNDTAEFITRSDIVAVTTQNDATATVVKVYGRITNTFEQWYFTPIMNTDQSPSKFVWSQQSGFLAALPTGTQTAAIYGNSNANTLNVQSYSGDTTTAFQVQNANSVSVFDVDTFNKRIGINNNAPTVDLDIGSTMTTGQIIQARIGDFLLQSQQGGANGLAALTSRGSNGNLTLDGASGSALYLSPFTTNNNYLASGGGKVRVGNQTAPTYTLDVTGDINSSTALRIGGTSVCDTVGATGCLAKSGSGYYIHNDTALQSGANFNISGTGIAATALQAPLIDTSSAVTLSIGTTNASGVSIATNNVAHTINIGNGGTSTTQAVTIGSTNGSSSTTIQGGTGASAISLTAGSGGSIKLTTASTGSINLTPGASGVFVQPTTDTTAAFQVIANASGNSVLRVDTTNERVGVGVISDPISAKLSVATSSTVSLRAYQGGASDAFQLGNATADFLTVGSTGNFLLKPTSNSSSAFRIQNSNASATLFTVDTSGNNIQIGSSTTDTTAILLTLDSYSTTADPTGIAGAMYYSTAYNAMRCYQNGSWSNCSDPTRMTKGFNIQEEFIASSSGGGNFTCGSGQFAAGYAWACNQSGTGATAAETGADSYLRPGQVQLGTGSTTTGLSSIYLGGGGANSFVIGGGETFETAINIPALSASGQDYLIRVGLCDNNAHAGTCSNGVYFEYNRNSLGTSWFGKTVKGGTSATTSTAKAAVTGWTNLKFVANSANSVTFYVKGPSDPSYVSLGTIGASTSVPNASANATTLMNIIDRTAGTGTAASTFTIDYIDYYNDFTTTR